MKYVYCKIFPNISNDDWEVEFGKVDDQERVENQENITSWGTGYFHEGTPKEEMLRRTKEILISSHTEKINNLQKSREKLQQLKIEE